MTTKPFDKSAINAVERLRWDLFRDGVISEGDLSPVPKLKQEHRRIVVTLAASASQRG
jgi:hypothetical protein